MHAMKVLGLFDCTSKTSVHHHHHHHHHHGGGGRVDSEDILEAHRTYLQSLIAAKIGGTDSQSNVVAFLESLEEEEDKFEGGQVDEAIEAMSYIGLLDDATKTHDPTHVDGGYSSIAPDPSSSSSSSSSSFIDQPLSSSIIMTTPMDSLFVLLD